MNPEPLRVLIVDDDEVVADLHRSFLRDLEGFVVTGSASTGPDAVAAMRRERPDVVLLDVHLPGMSGIEALRAIRADGRFQPEVIAVTAARDMDSVREARRAGVRHYLAKPFAAAELHSRLIEVGRELRATRRDEHLRQGEIDALMASRDGTGALPKGLSALTLASVHEALHHAPGSTAGEVGERVGISRVSARRYLEFLAEGGSATRSLDYQGGGRPKTRYTAIGRSKGTARD